MPIEWAADKDEDGGYQHGSQTGRETGEGDPAVHDAEPCEKAAGNDGACVHGVMSAFAHCSLRKRIIACEPVRKCCTWACAGCSIERATASARTEKHSTS